MNKSFYHRQNISKLPHRYYVYIHRKSSNDEPFYVGKGCDYRAWVDSGRNKYWHRVVNKYGFTVDIVFDCLLEEEAYLLEQDVIKELKYFGYKLANMTEGGDSPPLASPATIEKIRLARLGKPPHNKGKPQPHLRGANSTSSDKTIYTFINDSIGTFIGTRYEFVDNYSYITRDQLGKLFTSSPNKTCKGWYVLEFMNKFVKEENPELYTFQKTDDSEEKTCSIEQMAKFLSVPIKYVKRIINQAYGRKSVKGWKIKENYETKYS